MTLWKQLLLRLYYTGTYPMRFWQRRMAELDGRLPIVVVYYHRIADDDATPWTISNRVFRDQIHWLRDHFDLISLGAVQQLISLGENTRPRVCITFDDGYADNCHEAIPLLVKHGVPCTYFVTARNVLDGIPFQHDVQQGHPCAPNTIEQLRAMVGGGIDIGAHTYTHADLGKIHDPDKLRYELVAARHDLEDALGRWVRHFAFPFGRYENLSDDAFRLARKAGYSSACSAYGGVNFPGDDPFHIQRVPVDRWTIRLKNYVTLDPRKVSVPRYEALHRPDDEPQPDNAEAEQPEPSHSG
jgi:peptidoglycan/xylan/chitin deacetylase (PgdA/CDA1 family)